MASAAAIAAPNKKRERKYWNEQQDGILAEYIALNGVGKWDQVSKNTGLCEAGKTGNSCRMRWVNHLDPEINTEPFTEEEDETIVFLRNVVYRENRWAKIAERLLGRNDNQVKNRWNTKKLWERPTPNEESIRSLYEKVFLQVDHEPMDSKPEIDQDLLDDEPMDVNQQPFEESINTGGLSRVNVDQEILFDYTNAPDFNQFSLSDLEIRTIYEFSELNLEMNLL